MAVQQKDLIRIAFRDTLASKADDSLDWASLKGILQACNPEVCTEAKLEALIRTAVEENLADSAGPDAKVKLEPFLSWLLGADRPIKGAVEEGIQSLVLVGYGPVAHGFLTRLLEVSPFPCRFDLTVVCEEPYHAYNRVKLSTFFEHRTVDKLAYSGEEWCAKNGVRVVFGRADRIDRDKRTVEVALSGGGSETLRYDELVLATGSSPFVPREPAGLGDTPGVFVYRTVGDCQAIIGYAQGRTKAAVIGGGLLGLEAAKAVRDLGLEVAVVELAPALLVAQVDREAGGVVRQKVEALGVRVHTGAKILEVLRAADGSVSGLRIEEGGVVSEIEAQMVIVSAGIRPRHELAEACGLELGPRGGVKVDGSLRSVSDASVRAIGEVASVDGVCYGLAAPGFAQAEALVEHLMSPDAAAAYTGSDLSTKLKLLGVDVASFGGSSDFWLSGLYTSTDPEKVKTLVAKDEAAGSYKKLVFAPDGKRLLGGILVGPPAADFSKLAAVARRADLGGLQAEDIMAGATPAADDDCDGTNIGPADNVCNCNAVRKWVIQRAIEEGAGSFQDIRDRTRAGTGCGGCIAMGPVPKILGHMLRKLGRAQGLCSAVPFSEAEVAELAQTRKLKSFDAFAAEVCLGFEVLPKAEQEEARSKVTPILERVLGGMQDVAE